jgi:hypothetical protein
LYVKNFWISDRRSTNLDLLGGGSVTALEGSADTTHSTADTFHATAAYTTNKI